MDEALKRKLDESIRKWEARPRYGELSPGVLAAVPDHMLEQTVVDFVLAHGVWRDEDLVALLRSLPEGFGIAYTSWVLDAEVANGGFHQYFWNTEGNYVDLVTRAVARLGSAEHVHTLTEAIRIFRAEGKADVAHLDEREQLERFSASAQASDLGPLDSRWYELGDLAAARVRFIREAPALFAARLPLVPRLRLAIGNAVRGRRTSA
jgi:hypothetical protein